MNEEELEELFENIRNNEEKAFETLYAKYNRIIYGIAFSVVKNKEDAEDVMQAVFSKIYTMPKEKLEIQNISCWLYTITKNEAISLLRKKKETIDLDNVYEIQNENNEIEEIIDRMEFNRLIRGLKEKEREILSLKILANLSFSEISKLLNEPVGTIKWRYYKSIYSLRLMLTNFAMFILTFILGIKTAMSQNNINKESIKTNDVKEDIEKQSETFENTKNENFNFGINTNRPTTESATTSKAEDINMHFYQGATMLSISAIFLTITIILVIFSKKYKLKIKKRINK